MNNAIIENICYPRPNAEVLHTVYDFEITLINTILNGQVEKALNLYHKFFALESNYTAVSNNDIRILKTYLISVSMLISHRVIQKGVSTYSSKSKYQAFAKAIHKTSSKIEALNMGKTMVTAYATQVKKSLNKVDNISIRRAIDYILNNLGETLTLEEVANHANLSKCYFCTQFKKEMKMSFTDYLSHARIEKSKYLLCNSNKSILDIAILIGFNSQSYFTTQFKKYTGVSPKEFRAKKEDNEYVF